MLLPSSTLTTITCVLSLSLSLLQVSKAFPIILPKVVVSPMLPLLLRHPQQWQLHIAATMQHQHQSPQQSFLPNSLFVSTDNVAAIVDVDIDIDSIPTNYHAATALSLPSSLLADTDAVVRDIVGNGTGGGSGAAIEILQNVALGITAVLFLVAGLTYLTASVLIPAGAQQLEVECQQFIPQVWKEYQDKLEEGQEMKDRPDLMFELGLLLNKAKADDLETWCRQTDNVDLWNNYQSQLKNGQSMQDRPDLIQRLATEMGERAVQNVQDNCPPDLWKEYQSKLLPGETMYQRQDLLDQLVDESAYRTLFEATDGKGIANVMVQRPRASSDRSNGVVDAEVTTPKSQWEDDNDDDS